MPRLATPISDGFFDSLDPASAAAIGALDERSLREEKARVAPWVADKLTAPTHSVQNQVRMWERLTIRIAQDWPPDGTYLIDEYVNDLETRDSLESTLNELPPPVADELRGALNRLDGAFRDTTYDDDGASIAWRMNESKLALKLRPWWWQRRPANAPWAEA